MQRKGNMDMKGYEDELFVPGHTACAGCPIPIIIRTILKVTGKNVIISNATSCSEIISSCYPLTSWRVPYIHVAFETAASVASGIEAALKTLKKDTHVVALAGDGGTFDIGLQALSGMIDREHNVLYICYSNESYANTGVQRSSATPKYAWTTTSPVGKYMPGNKYNQKPIVEMLVAQGIPYAATASIAFLEDYEKKVKKALEIRGPKFILVQAPCPTGWRFPSNLTIEVAKKAVETGMWVLYEVEQGKKRITYAPKPRKHVKEYLTLQKRFAHLTEKQIEEIEKYVEKTWKSLEPLL